MELPRAAVLVVHRDAGDVGREQVRRELNPVVGALNGRGQGPRERGLAGARGVLEQEVAFGEHARQGQPDDRTLAEQRQADVVDELAESAGEPGRVLGSDCHEISPRSLCSLLSAVVDANPRRIISQQPPGRARRRDDVSISGTVNGKRAIPISRTYTIHKAIDIAIGSIIA